MYFEPRTNSVTMNEDKIFFLRGFYTNSNGIIEIWVLDLTDEPKLLLQRTKVGKCIQADQLPVLDAEQNRRVNTLGHQPVKSLSAAELQVQ